MRIRWMSAMAAAATVTIAACNEGASPTEPILREPTPAPPVSALLGEWHGTMAYRGGDCVSEEVNATASPEGSGVRVNVRSLCHGNVVFRVQELPSGISGEAEVVYPGSCSSIFGPVTRPTLQARASGTTDTGRLHLETAQFTSRFASCTRPGVTLDLAR